METVFCRLLLCALWGLATTTFVVEGQAFHRVNLNFYRGNAFKCLAYTHKLMLCTPLCDAVSFGCQDIACASQNHGSIFSFVASTTCSGNPVGFAPLSSALWAAALYADSQVHPERGVTDPQLTHNATDKLWADWTSSKVACWCYLVVIYFDFRSILWNNRTLLILFYSHCRRRKRNAHALTSAIM
jgi:hypothetical protein